MATIERGHSGWMVSFHSTNGDTHSTFTDLPPDVRDRLGEIAARSFREFLAAYEGGVTRARIEAALNFGVDMPDRSRLDIIALAKETIDKYGGPEHARVFFKWTCGACKRRQAIPTPNALPDTATCETCGHTQALDGAGFMLNVRRNGGVDWDSDPFLFVSKRPAEAKAEG